jgi:hypothetical protein
LEIIGYCISYFINMRKYKMLKCLGPTIGSNPKTLRYLKLETLERALSHGNDPDIEFVKHATRQFPLMVLVIIIS